MKVEMVMGLSVSLAEASSCAEFARELSVCKCWISM